MSIKLFVELLWWTWPAYLWPPSYTHAFSQIVTCWVQDEYLSVADPTSKPQGIHPNQQLQQQISISNTCSFFASLNQKLYVHKVVQVVHVWHVVCHFLWGNHKEAQLSSCWLCLDVVCVHNWLYRSSDVPFMLIIWLERRQTSAQQNLSWWVQVTTLFIGTLPRLEYTPWNTWTTTTLHVYL